VRTNKGGGKIRTRTYGILFLVLIVAITSAVLGTTTTYTVPVSSVGVLFNTYSGQITGPFPSGTQFFQKYPWVTLYIIPTSVQTIYLSDNNNASDNAKVYVLTHDNLEINFEVNLRYQINATNAVNLFRKFPSLNWETAAIIPHIRTAARTVVAGIDAPNIQNSQAQIQTDIAGNITLAINGDTSLASAINIVSIQVTDITLPGAFLAAIQNKLNAQQQLLQAQFQAEQLVVLAEGQKNATIIAAEAQANATVIQANAQSQSISNIILQVETTTHTTWNSTQVAAFTTLYSELRLLSNLTGQNMYIFLGSPNGQIIIPTQSTA
jgi:regulator of protease activity HflC (stomatin/prohibitin superfamily)